MASKETRRFLLPEDEVVEVLSRCIRIVEQSHQVDNEIDLSEFTAKYDYRKVPALKKDCKSRGLPIDGAFQCGES